MAAMFTQSHSYLTWGGGIKLLKGEAVGAGNSLSNQAANKV